MNLDCRDLVEVNFERASSTNRQGDVFGDASSGEPPDRFLVQRGFGGLLTLIQTISGLRL
jgi:hypothetical protein